MGTHATLHIWTWKADYQIKSLQICSVQLRSVRPALKNDTRETHSYKEHKWRDEANKGRASGKSQVLGITDLLQVFHILLILKVMYVQKSLNKMISEESAKLEATVFFGAICPVFRQGEGWADRFQREGPGACEKSQRWEILAWESWTESRWIKFFFTYIHGLTMFDVENMLQNMTTCCPTIIQYRLMPRDLTYLTQRSELMSSKRTILLACLAVHRNDNSPLPFSRLSTFPIKLWSPCTLKAVLQVEKPTRRTPGISPCSWPYRVSI